MFPQAARELMRVCGGLDGLLSHLALLAGRPKEDLLREIEEHVAARLFFLVVGELQDASNYDSIGSRLGHALPGIPPAELARLHEFFAATVVHIEAAQLGRRSSLADLPYYQRQKLFRAQAYRCAVCGWSFEHNRDSRRSDAEIQPVLDHRVPYRIGGDRAENLWILCGLCNAIKREYFHVGESGRIWIDNTVYPARERAIAFWTFWREPSCTHTLCTRSARDGRLYATRVRQGGAWTVDTCRTRCAVHAKGLDVIAY